MDPSIFSHFNSTFLHPQISWQGYQWLWLFFAEWQVGDDDSELFVDAADRGAV